MRKSCVHLSFPPFPSSSTYMALTTVGHIAENCTSQERLCYNCRKPGHESSVCTEARSFAAKQCYSCGGIGHIQAECPTLRLQGSNQKCYVRALLTMEEMLSGCVNFFLDDLFIELRPFWTYRARVSQRSGARPWFCVACAPPWSRTEHGVTPAYQVLSLRWTEPHGPVCGLVTSCTY
jgi:hypothetical protein